MLGARANSILEAVAADGLPFGRGVSKSMKQGDFRCENPACNTKLGEFYTVDGENILFIKYKDLRVEQRMAQGMVVITCPNCRFSRMWASDVTHTRVVVQQPSTQDWYTTEEEVGEFDCPHCDFQAKTKAGLHSHTRNRHPES